MTRPTLNDDASMVIVPDGPCISWDATNNRPVDWQCQAGRIWEDVKTKYGIATPDPYVAPTPPPPVVDGAVFLARITDAEYTAITTSTNVSVLRWIEVLRMKGVVNLGDATAIAAKAGLVALGLMTQDRADAVFAP